MSRSEGPQVSRRERPHVSRRDGPTEWLSFRGRPRSGADGLTRDVLTWSEFGLRRARPEDADAVRSWIASPTEARFVGASTFPVPKSEVSSWIEDSVEAFILQQREPEVEGPRARTVGFINIAPADRDVAAAEFEIGRLVVAPDSRRRGVAATLARYAHERALQKFESRHATSPRLPPWPGHALAVSRVHTDNLAGQRVARVLRMGPAIETETGSAYSTTWFRYPLQPRPPRLGSIVQRLRLARGLSPSDLAFLCSMSAPALNMLESGKRRVSLARLERIASAVAESSLDVVTLALAGIGRAPGDDVLVHERLPNAPVTADVDLWILSDTLAELTLQTYYEATVKAIRAGRTRWYFLPPGGWESSGRLLLARLERDVERRALEASVRIFEAPASLCHLRLAIHNPGPQRAESITVIGPNDRRIPVPDSQAAGVLRGLWEEITRMDAEFDHRAGERTCWLRQLYPARKRA